MLGRDETFFALPYDPLYYYLAGRPSPVRELAFFEFVRVTPRQEGEILLALDARPVDVVVVSNRSQAREIALGRFGETYGHELASWLGREFRPAAGFGLWEADPGWAWSHATRIHRRRAASEGVRP